jgi:DNA recombination protein RmuC
MEWIIAAVAGIIIGYLFSFLVAKGQKQVLASKLEMLQNLLDSEKHQSEETVKELNCRLESVKEETRLIVEQMKEEEQKKVADIKMESQKQTEYALKIQQERFDETIAKVTAQLKSATDEMLKQRQKEFAESSHVNIGQIVNPLRETIDKMKVVMNDSTLKQTAMTSEMKVNMENMMRQSQAAKQSADELARVFKHRSKVQGDWGETVLAELLDSQGLTKGVHYDVQSVIKDAEGYVVKSMEGSIMRPDVILHLDQRREVIIDSKVSLTSFMDYVNAEDEDVRQMHLKAHIDSIQKHVKELSAKDYSSYVQAPKVKMDYVIMFVPHTGALWTALHSQPDLWRKAMDKNVFIADEQTLFAALRIINLTWTQIAQAQNHEKVYALANEMLDRVGQFMKKYQAIGKALENATKAYEDGEKKLLPGGQSILQTCGKLEKLGAKQSDKNPLPQLIDLDEIPTIE